ncbi:MAG TPA: protein kinase [Candidatus Hydrogenedentes bacterium]|nr:protein kinase [Candidatus Hydrogenedentota bacterium]HQM49273.1 protein kinase [Candidatus Hydrogenedentota bacterium]
MNNDQTEPFAEDIPATEDTHRIECGCGHILEVHDDDLGRTLRCPACDGLVYLAHELVSPVSPPKVTRHYSDDEVPADLKPGDRFMATYEVRELIGRGGMAYVHRVHHKGWGIDLALKTPKPDLVLRNDWQRDFERECETWVGLTPHPNVVRCHYVRRLGGIPRLFLEFVPGGSLVHWARKNLLYRGDSGEVLKRVLDVAMQVAWGLNHAHEQGLIHQDVKPGNILMTLNGQAKVTDFGLMRAFGGSNAGPSFYPTSGTPPYSAPEQGPHTPPSHLADIWGWGASLFEMFVGTPRWSNSQELLQLFEEYLANRLERPRIAHIPEPLADLLKNCFRERPQDRPGSMQSVIEALREVYQWTVGVPYEREHPHPVLASAGVLNNRAISLFELGKQQEAETLWQQALALTPDHLESRFNNLLYEWRTGRCTDIAVIRSLMELLEEKKRSPKVRYLLARIMLEWGDCRVAADILHRIEVSPQNMREIDVALGATKEALEDTRGLVAEFGQDARTVKAICLLEDGRLGLVGKQDGSVECWNPFAGECLKTFEAHPGGVFALACSYDNRTLVSGGADGMVKLWELPDCALIASFSGHGGPVRGVAVDREVTMVVSGSQDHTVRVWRVETGECMNVLEGHTAGVNAVALDAAGVYALSGGRDATAKVWNLREANCLRTLKGHTHRIHAVCLSEDARLAVTASRDRHVVLWNTDSGEPLRTLHGHVTEAYSAAFTRDKAHVFTGSRQGTLRLWNADTGQCLHTFNGGAPAHLERTGTYALSSSRNGPLKFWRVSCARRFLPATFAPSLEE